MSFLKQLFGITTRRDPAVQKLARPNHKTLVTAMDYEYWKGEEGYNLSIILVTNIQTFFSLHNLIIMEH
jgi:hypothetical protein